jgi:hypothetical protein
MPPEAIDPLDWLIPSSRAVEHHLTRLDGARDLLARLLDVSREYERRREQSGGTRQAEQEGRR